jgi:S1-C subfamily serine protease
MSKYLLCIILFVIFFLTAQPATADFKSEEDKSIETSQKLLNATVKVEWGDIRTGGAEGTGFYIAPNTILTAEHVIHLAPSSQVKLTKKDGTVCTGTIGYREEITPDLSIITTDCTGTPLTLATSAVEGQTILAAGNPSGYDFTVSKGIIGAFRSGYIQFDAKVNYGSSGGILSNLGGEIVGVVVQKALGDTYIGFAQPYSTVKKFLEHSGVNQN